MATRENAANGKRDLVTLFTISGVKAGASLLAFVTSVIAARLFVPEDFGRLSLLWSIAAVLMVAIDFGVTISYRKYGWDQTATRSLLGRSLLGYGIRAFLLGAILPVFIWAGAISSDHIFFALAAPLALAFALEMLTAEIFRARRFYFWSEVFSGGFRQLLYLGALGLAALAQLTLDTFAASLAFGMVLAGGVAVFMIGRPTLDRHSGGRSQSAERRRFFATQIVILAGQQFPLLAAGAFADDATAAIVRVALLFGMLMQFGTAGNAMYFAPKLASARDDDRDHVTALLRRSSRLGLLFALMGAALCLLLPVVIPPLFGSHYAASIRGAQMVVLALAVSASLGGYGQMLLLRGYDHVNLQAAVVLLAVEAVLLLPLLGAMPVTGYLLAYAIGILVSMIFLGVAGRRASGFRAGPF